MDCADPGARSSRFLLLSVWACPVGGVREYNYVGQIHKAIVRHPRWFDEKLPTVICGDFNSNTIFDPGRKKKTHSSLVQLLAKHGLASAYHEFFAESHGKETRPTITSGIAWNGAFTSTTSSCHATGSQA
jgi:hypothetical protein